MELALSGGERPIQSHEVAQRRHIPPPYLDQIFLQLRRGGIVRSVRGAAGGFFLARPADEIPVASVLRALRGDLAVFKAPENGGGAGAIAELWSRLQERVDDVVENTTLADLAERQRALDQQQAPMFYI